VVSDLTEMLEKHPAAPFLFIGSGFSRRYLGLEDWSGILARFCAPIKDFNYYLAKADGDLPLTATYIADDFYEWWWSSDEVKESREEFSKKVNKKSDPLKYEITKYLRGKGIATVAGTTWSDEIPLLAKINVDGIITTNWDGLIEDIFPEYKVFVGQDELLFSNPQSIGEIYKIHGSISEPTSFVLTDEDYKSFGKKNPYLAAKLVTVFVEHPIIFLGYSINDPHIKSIIMSIAGCLTQDKISQFEQNLFFVQRPKGTQMSGVEKVTLQSADLSITMTVIRTESFAPVYAALSATKRKIPARLLRFFKEQLYELTRAPATAEKKLAVVDYEDIESADQVEFVVGLGVAKRSEEFGEKAAQRVQDALDRKGYAGVTTDEVFEDCINEDSKFAAADLLDAAYPVYSRSHRTFIPVFKYLKAVGIESAQGLSDSKYEGAKKIVAKLAKADYTLPSYARRFNSDFAGMTSTEIIHHASSPTEALLMLAFQKEGDFELDVVRDFLCQNAKEFDGEPYKTAYRKLICLYDKRTFGF